MMMCAYFMFKLSSRGLGYSRGEGPRDLTRATRHARAEPLGMFKVYTEYARST